MTHRAKLILAFAAGVVFGAACAASAVSWKWNRDFDNWSTMQVANQAFVAREIYAGRSEELAERILNDLPGYVADIGSVYSETVSTPMAVRWIEDAYRQSGEPIPDEAREVLDRLSSASN